MTKLLLCMYLSDVGVCMCVFAFRHADRGIHYLNQPFPDSAGIIYTIS